MFLEHSKLCDMVLLDIGYYFNNYNFFFEVALCFDSSEWNFPLRTTYLEIIIILKFECFFF